MPDPCPLYSRHVWGGAPAKAGSISTWFDSSGKHSRPFNSPTDDEWHDNCMFCNAPRPHDSI